MKKIAVIIPVLLIILLSSCNIGADKEAYEYVTSSSWVYGDSYYDAQESNTTIQFNEKEIIIKDNISDNTEKYSYKITGGILKLNTEEPGTFFKSIAYSIVVGDNALKLTDDENNNIVLYPKVDIQMNSVTTDELTGTWFADNVCMVFTSSTEGYCQEFSGTKWKTTYFTFVLKKNNMWDTLTLTYENDTQKQYNIKYSSNVNTLKFSDEEGNITVFSRQT